MSEKIKSRSISPENFTGKKGKAAKALTGMGAHAARDLGRGWKISPNILVRPGETATLAEIDGPGVITKSWLTAPNNRMRDFILRMYWDGEKKPSVEVPAADFYCDGWLTRPIITSDKIKLLPANGYGSRWKMPFREGAKITLENIGEDVPHLYYQYSYDERKVSKDEPYFNATWRRANPLGDPAEFTIVDGIEGEGYYAGTYMGIQPNWDGWWGEGEPKFYMDGDKKWPTIAFTGTEDYFGGAWNFDRSGEYAEYSDRDCGFHVSPNDVIYKGYQRIGMYNWHIDDPIRFEDDLRVTIQAIGAGDKFVPLVNADVFATSYWYQSSKNRSPQPSLKKQARKLGYGSLRDYLHIAPQPIPNERELLLASLAQVLSIADPHNTMPSLSEQEYLQ